MYVALACVIGLTGAMEVSNEPVAIVVQYPEMQDISLAPEDVMIYSEAIPHVETIQGAQVVYSQRTMAEMAAANIPEPPPESKPTLPNESREKKRLDHTPPFNGTVTGDVSIIESGPQERIIVVSNIQGDGIMQVLVKGGTARTGDGANAKPVLNTPKILVRNTKTATDMVIRGTATTAATASLDRPRERSLKQHFDGTLPSNLKMVAEPIVVK